MSKGYRNALQALSTRTGAPLSSLIVSFGILHEVTAVVPLVAVFYGSRSLGIGEGIINAVLPKENDPNPPSWPAGVVQNWVTEGEAWAARIGRRYGVFGFEKGQSGTVDDKHTPGPSQLSSRLAGDVANAIVAYGVTKVYCRFRDQVLLWLIPTSGVTSRSHRTFVIPFPCIF
jgi:hypothetical protein